MERLRLFVVSTEHRWGLKTRKTRMNYWLDLFTGTTWKQFRDAGANVSGFRDRMRNASARIKEGDVLLCYLTGVMRWVGALEVIGHSSDTRAIWGDGEFPIRLDVKPLILLEPENGVPMTDLEGKVRFYSSPREYGRTFQSIQDATDVFVHLVPQCAVAEEWATVFGREHEVEQDFGEGLWHEAKGERLENLIQLFQS